MRNSNGYRPDTLASGRSTTIQGYSDECSSRREFDCEEAVYAHTVTEQPDEATKKCAVRGVLKWKIRHKGGFSSVPGSMYLT